jgi:glucose/arabinose dehydrogenase
MKSQHVQARFSRLAATARIFAIVGLALFCFASNGHARTVSMRWLDPNPDPSPVSGFRLHVGTTSRAYDLVYDIGRPEADAAGIRTGTADVPDNIDVYVAMTAYDDEGNESGLSNEKMWQATGTPNDAPPQSTIDRPIGPQSIAAGGSVSFAGSGSSPDNLALEYFWDFDGAGVSTAKDPGAVVFSTAGVYTVSFFVTDSEGVADPVPAVVVINVETVEALNAAISLPTKNVTITEGQSVFFAGRGEGGRAPYDFAWDFDFGRSGVSPSDAALPGQVVFDTPGSFTVQLNVTDADGRVDASPAIASVTVEPVNDPEPPRVGNGSFPDSSDVVSELVASGLASPVYLTAPLGDPRLFVAEAGGVIRIVEDGTVLTTPFLDLGFTSVGQELLSFAFDPEYAKNGLFYVHWVDSVGSDDTVVLTRFEVGSDANVADPDSEEEILAVPQPFDSQNGGAIAFSPKDGFLYIGMGDGGSTDDPANVSQDASKLLGKVLRIDVAVPPSPDSTPAGAYAIPNDNPFVGDSRVRDEIWAFGVRNPYRFSFDRDLGDLWLADEGQELREEINFEPNDSPGGNNYGWDVMEGTACAAETPCNGESFTPPFHEYPHDDNACSITGGYVYRGTEDTLYGEYFYGDYCSGAIWSINRNTGEGTNWTRAFGEAAGKRREIASFGEGGGGALYVLHENGDIYRIGAVAPACDDQLDNDNDGQIDIGIDPGCRNSKSEIEDPACDDGLDNDGDDMIDVLDPECEVAWSSSESVSVDEGGGGGGGGGKKCGLGAELAFLLPPVMWLRRRRKTTIEPAPRISRFALDRNA